MVRVGYTPVRLGPVRGQRDCQVVLARTSSRSRMLLQFNLPTAGSFRDAQRAYTHTHTLKWSEKRRTGTREPHARE